MVADLFVVEGITYLAYADRLTGWLEITPFRAEATCDWIVIRLREYFRKWCVPDQITTDDGTNLVKLEMTLTDFLAFFGVEVRL